MVVRTCLALVIAGAACTSEEPPPPIAVDPDDVDGDGIANAADNCPRTKNLAQHDEDADGVGDTCDVCPAVVDPNQFDTGEIGAMQFGDGVGDFCDPRPTRDGDKLAAFHPFVTDTSDDWSGDGWTIGADVVRTVSTASWFNRHAERGDNLYVQAILPSIIWLAPQGAVRVIVDGTEGFACAIEHDLAGGLDKISMFEAGTRIQTETLGTVVEGPVGITTWRSINFMREMTIICRVETPNDEKELRINGLVEFSTGQYAIESRGAITDISSISAYVSPVSPCLSTSAAERACEDE